MKTKIFVLAMLSIMFFGNERINAQNDHLSPFTGFQGDHLRPVTGFFELLDFSLDYYSTIRKVLFDGLPDSYFFRFMVVPSFTPIKVLDIGKEKYDGPYYLTYHTFAYLDNNGYVYDDFENKEKVKVKKIKKVISNDSFKLIDKLFTIAIYQTKFSDEFRLINDGVTYYFTIFDKGIKTGKIHSPPEGTKISKLATIGEELIHLAENDDEIIDFNDLYIEKIKGLIKEFEEADSLKNKQKSNDN